MKTLIITFLVSLFLGTGIALAGGGNFDEPPQQSVPKVIVNVPEPQTNWAVPITIALVGGLATLGAAYIARSKRKEK